MSSIVNWVKNNKLATVLLLVVGYMLFRSFYNSFFGVNILSLDVPNSRKSTALEGAAPYGSTADSAAGVGNLALPDIYPPEPEYTPQTDVGDRLVIQNSNLSLQVTDVVDARNKILEHTRNNGGYMVNSSTTSPEEAPFATVTIRIPADKLQATLDYFHSLSVKVVSENLVGRDVTDQYVDIDKRIETYENSKSRFEAILEQATKVEDITRLTREIINMQAQIDSLKGQQQSLEQNAALAKVTVYLSTDEIALPYAPSETFRPGVIFKLAVRSLVGFLRNLASLAIWLGVYSVIWFPVLLIIWYLRKRRNTRSPEKMSN